MVEFQGDEYTLAKVDVVGSNPITRFLKPSLEHTERRFSRKMQVVRIRSIRWSVGLPEILKSIVAC